MIKGLVVSGYGINCEEETAYALNSVSIAADIVHVSNLLASPDCIADYHVLAFPGGFSFADKLGSGNAFALKAQPLSSSIRNFLEQKKLIIGICNGAQILSRLFPELGLAFDYNTSDLYQCEWHEMHVNSKASPWLHGISNIRLPIAHGEGNLKTNCDTSASWNVGIQYTKDVNGSYDRIAAVTAYDGQMLITMPHPERAIFFSQTDTYFMERENYRRSKTPTPIEGAGRQIFRNAYNYFQQL